MSADGTTMAIGDFFSDTYAEKGGLLQVFDISGIVSDDNTLSLDDSALDEIKLYPNPTSEDKVHILMPEGKEIIKVVLYNSLGQRMLTTKNTNLDVSNFAKGAYLLRITSGDGILTKKLIVN